MKRVIVSVINDLVTDQRVHKSCLTLQKTGFDVLLVGRKMKKSPQMDKRSYQSHRMKLLFEKGPFFYAEYNIRLFFFLLFHRCNLLLSNDLDTSLPNYFVSRLKKIPMIYDSHEYFTETPELVTRPKVQKIWKRIEWFILNRQKEMITVNESIANLFREKYNIKVHVIRNIPFRLNTKTSLTREELQIPDNKHLIVLQGSGINVQRGAEELVEAMLYLDDCILMVIGGGDVLPVLKEMVSELKLEEKVRFLPRMPYQKMMAHTQLAELGFTLDKNTNLNYRFSLPNKIFDYIQAGIPVVSSHLPEIEKIITEYQIGCFVENHTPECIANSVKEAFSNNQLYLQWKNNLNFAAEQLCWENEEKTLLNIYGQFI